MKYELVGFGKERQENMKLEEVQGRMATLENTVRAVEDRMMKVSKMIWK